MNRIISFGNGLLKNGANINAYPQLCNLLCNKMVISQPTSTFHTSCSLDRRKHGILHPHGVSFQWAYKEIGINKEEYTHEALPKLKHGGRGPEGQIQFKHIGGGLRRPYFMVDYKRHGDLQTGKPLEEKVLQIKKTWYRNTPIALVASGSHKRWVLATKNLQAGDIIRSHCEIPIIPVNPKEGDSHPLGALPLGTVVSCIERTPGKGGEVAIKAGTCGVLVKHVTGKDALPHANYCHVRQPHKREMKVLATCTAVVGQMGNEDHNKIKFYKFGQKRWLGIKQRSGFFQKKTGRFGRKIRPIKSASQHFDLPPKRDLLRYQYTVPGTWDWVKQKGKNRLYKYEPAPGEKNPRFRWSVRDSVR